MVRGKTSEPYVRTTDRKVYVTPAYFELAHGRDLRTVRDWARTQRVRSMWHNDTLYVHLKDCLDLDGRTPNQERGKQEAS